MKRESQSFGYCRVSTPKQSIERQKRNIRSVCPGIPMFEDVFTGTKTEGRKKWESLMRTVQAGDTIYFDSVSRMSRNAEEGFETYKQLMEKGIDLVFLKEPQINTATYKEAMERHPESALHAIAAANGGVEGRTAFQAAEQGDETALAVCRAYAEYLAAGLTNLVNILHPEAVALGGGVAAAPEHLLLDPVREIVARECYARHVDQVPRIIRAELGNDAGIIGAAMLGRAI